MAFMGILLINILAIIAVIIIFAIFIIGIIAVILFLVFLVLYNKDKSKKIRKKICILSGIVGFSILIVYSIFFLIISTGHKDVIDIGDGKNVEVSHKIVKDFFESIENNDISKLNELLDKYPYLVNSYKNDNNTPLEIAIINKQYDCVVLLVEKNANINIMDKDDPIGPIELELIHFDTDNKGFRNYDEKIMEYLLHQDNIDVNKHNGDIPNIQAYIELILMDNVISAKEEELLIKMLDKNADIYELNSNSQNTMQFLDKLEFSENVNKIKKIVLRYDNFYIN